jgi:hypothetical protein
VTEAQCLTFDTDLHDDDEHLQDGQGSKNQTPPRNMTAERVISEALDSKPLPITSFATQEAQDNELNHFFHNLQYQSLENISDLEVAYFTALKEIESLEHQVGTLKHEVGTLKHEVGVCNERTLEAEEKAQAYSEAFTNLNLVITRLREEIARLKKVPDAPKLKPNLDPFQPDGESDVKGPKPRGGSAAGPRAKKTPELKINKVEPVDPIDLPVNAVFCGSDDYIVQDLIVSPHVVCYQINSYAIPGGGMVRGELPESVRGHFGPGLISQILLLHTQGRLTEPLLRDYLLNQGIHISSGQLHAILTKGHDAFHEEKEEILAAALKVSPSINVDDTGMRHDGHNGFCTVICNHFFTYYETTAYKSRINFLKVLLQGKMTYVITDESLIYLERYENLKLPLEDLKIGTWFENENDWKAFLAKLNISQPNKVRALTEAALLGALVEQEINPDLVLVSDDAGQFNLFNHGLCWVHADRHVKKLSPVSPEYEKAQAKVRDEIWTFYKKLLAFKKASPEEQAEQIVSLKVEFDTIFTQKTCYRDLNSVLERLNANKDELLLILEKPETPLHNNQAETDIRDRVISRKISVTFSDNGRRCRDTFASLKKTCKKLKISYGAYLKDRIYRINSMPRLADVVSQHILDAALLHPA